MPTDNFRLAPAFDAFGTAVPDRYPAFGVKHVDRIIGRAVDEQSEFVGAYRYVIHSPAQSSRSPGIGSINSSGGLHGVSVPFVPRR